VAIKRIDELSAATPLLTDFLPVTPTGGPSSKATTASVVVAGLNQPNSTTGAGANLTIKAANAGVTNGAGGSIILRPGLQLTSGGDGQVRLADAANANNYLAIANASGHCSVSTSGWSYIKVNNTLYTNQSSFGFSVGSEWVTAALKHAGGSSQHMAVIQVTDGSTGGGSFAYTHENINLTSVTDAASITGSGYQRITGGTVLNGILPPPPAGVHVSGRMIKIVNTTGSAITVANESTSVTTVGNRLKTPTGASINLGANHMLQCIYDTVDSRWRVWMTS